MGGSLWLNAIVSEQPQHTYVTKNIPPGSGPDQAPHMPRESLECLTRIRRKAACNKRTNYARMCVCVCVLWARARENCTWQTLQFKVLTRIAVVTPTHAHLLARTHTHTRTHSLCNFASAHWAHWALCPHSHPDSWKRSCLFQSLPVVSGFSECEFRVYKRKGFEKII